MNRVAVLTVCITGLWVASRLLAAEPAVRAPFDAIVKVAAVSARDSGGRVQRFTDAGNREFAVKYNQQQRVQAVEATRGPHVSDIVSVGYGADSKLAGVAFRTGYVLFFDQQSNGAQVIRDSRGGAVIRSASRIQPLDSAATEQSTKLAAAIAEVESLMAALGQPLR